MRHYIVWMGFVITVAFQCCQPSQTTGQKEEPLLHLNSFLDTTYADSSKQLIVQTLQSFLAIKNEAAHHNPYWLTSDFEVYKYPYLDIYNIEQQGKYKPSLLDIVTLKQDSLYNIKLAFLANRNLHSIYNFLAIKQPDGSYRFSRIVDYNTRKWERKRVGNIEYIISPQHDFDVQEAQRLDSFNDATAHFFEIEPITLTYYLCVDPQELFQIRGFDYQPVMYKFKTGGQNESWSNIIYAGNNTAWYPHEVVHSYTYAKYGRQIHRVFDEGIATYLGGSNELPLRVHLDNLKNYLEENPTAKVYDLLYNNIEIDDRQTNCLYAIGGLFCQVALEEMGKPYLIELFQGGKTKDAFKTTLKSMYGITSNEELDVFVREKLGVQ